MLPQVGPAEAIALVRREVETRNKEQQFGEPLAVDETSLGELWWAWVVAAQSVRYLQTGEDSYLLIGLGPYLVDKFTREVIPTGTGTDLHELERSKGYRRWWRRRGPQRVWEIPFAPLKTEPLSRR
jgi:hypothetical protein